MDDTPFVNPPGTSGQPESQGSGPYSRGDVRMSHAGQQWREKHQRRRIVTLLVALTLIASAAIIIPGIINRDSNSQFGFSCSETQQLSDDATWFDRAAHEAEQFAKDVGLCADL